MGLGGLPAPGGDRGGVSANAEHGECPWAGLEVSWGHICHLGGALWADTLAPAHAFGRGGSFFVVLGLRLGVCDHNFQLEQPLWVPREWQEHQESESKG